MAEDELFLLTKKKELTGLEMDTLHESVSSVHPTANALAVYGTVLYRAGQYDEAYRVAAKIPSDHGISDRILWACKSELSDLDRRDIGAHPILTGQPA
ncbi:hypothetical protein A3840_18740 [Devosia elaeis]|uniref:Tetratricopeptide repeat protein n=2 Tax=Devosia elaeis TaxID=1770058 RepID=A0A178HJU7_9HYPH|nr:hypothetical protein A3840_18740 [Devosia elaeis]